MRTENDRSQFFHSHSYTGGEGCVVHGVQQLASEQALLGVKVQSRSGITGNPPASPRHTGHVVQGAPINLYAKKYKPLQGLGQAFSKFRTFALQCSQAWH